LIVSVLKRERPPIPGVEPAVSYAYSGTGPIIDHSKSEATIALNEQGFAQARDQLLQGAAYEVDLEGQDVIALSIPGAAEETLKQRAMQAAARLREGSHQAST
ncbi:MAG TPA: hypothetical protein VNF91_08820, partial [Candidatus Acidoferrum sp.]|nr:hypothetical protein [Candidatus Acidoferrum sp.]